jgi:hypothetical protein
MMRLATSGLMIITFILLRSYSIVSTIVLRLLFVSRGGGQKGSKRWGNDFDPALEVPGIAGRIGRPAFAGGRQHARENASYYECCEQDFDEHCTDPFL